jgi:peptide/nickel transport system permease protein
MIRTVSVWRLRWHRFRRHKAGVASIALLIVLVLFSAAAAPVERGLGLDANVTDLMSRFQPPSPSHWLGTDEAGRDELVRLMYGGEISLTAAFLATLVGGVFGVAIGVTAGYFGGWVDGVLMRCTDGMIALPLLPLLIVLAAIDLTKLGFSSEFAHSGAAGFWRMVVIIALVDWTQIARVVRAQTLSIRKADYIAAAVASGAKPAYVMIIHILPNLAAPITVAFTLTIGRVVLFESVLSFLGFGVVPPTPSWGNMLNNAQELLTAAPALAIYPGLLIFATVIAVNFVGDGLQQAFDPRSDGRN